MTTDELRELALRAAGVTNEGARFEDGRVELKSQWPDPLEMARQIAAQANSRGRQEFVWLLGIRQKSGVVGAPVRDGAEWLPALRTHFDQGVMPKLSAHENLEINGKNIVALVWDPADPPYVVKLREGKISREVPWREGESVRSADRRELLRILEPIALAPAVDFLWHQRNHIAASLVEGGMGLKWSMRLAFRVSPRTASPVVIPYRATTCKLSGGPASPDILDFTLFMETGDGETPFRVTGLGEVTFSAPASITLFTGGHPSRLINRPEVLHCETSFMAAGASEPTVVETEWHEIVPAPNQLWGFWKTPGVPDTGHWE